MMMMMIDDEVGVHVVTFISNCKKAGGANRLKFIQELMTYIPVRF